MRGGAVVAATAAILTLAACSSGGSSATGGTRGAGPGAGTAAIDPGVNAMWSSHAQGMGDAILGAYAHISAQGLAGSSATQLSPAEGDAGGCRLVNVVPDSNGSGDETFDMTVRYGGFVTCPSSKQANMVDRVSITVTKSDGTVVFRGQIQSPVTSDPQRRWVVQMTGVDSQGGTWHLAGGDLNDLNSAQAAEMAFSNLVSSGSDSYYVNDVSEPAH